MIEYDLVIIGAGPAGMAAAITAKKYGLKVLVIDEQSIPGGQIYRNIEEIESKRNSQFKKLGEEYRAASQLVKEFRSAGVEYLPRHSVWHIEKDLTIYYFPIGQNQDQPLDSSSLSGEGSKDPSHVCKAKQLIIAIGAMERPMPFPGWTLPGVMACTVADVLFKNSNLIPKGKVVLAGEGPLLLLVACRMIDLGVNIGAYLDTGSHSKLYSALPYLPKAMLAPQYLFKGFSMLQKIKKAKIPHFRGIKELEVSGNSQLKEIKFRTGNHWKKLSADILLLHQGVIPNVQITRHLGCQHQWYPRQRYWEPVLDEWGQTSLPGVYVAGDSAKIYGGAASECSGHIAALGIAHILKQISIEERDQQAALYRRQLKKHRAPRNFLDQLFSPEKNWLVPANLETLVCRCEEVSVEDIRSMVQLGMESPDKVKSMIRCGMGPCQGRMCGLTVSEIIADERKLNPDQIGYFRLRSPIKPVTLEELAKTAS